MPRSWLVLWGQGFIFPCPAARFLKSTTSTRYHLEHTPSEEQPVAPYGSPPGAPLTLSAPPSVPALSTEYPSQHQGFRSMLQLPAARSLCAAAATPSSGVVPLWPLPYLPKQPSQLHSQASSLPHSQLPQSPRNTSQQSRASAANGTRHHAPHIHPSHNSAFLVLNRCM